MVPTGTELHYHELMIYTTIRSGTTNSVCRFSVHNTSICVQLCHNYTNIYIYIQYLYIGTYNNFKYMDTFFALVTFLLFFFYNILYLYYIIIESSIQIQMLKSLYPILQSLLLTKLLKIVDLLWQQCY